MEIFILTAGVFLAFANGANDNFKGFATVWGSNALGYRAALLWASFATAAGSVVSVVLASGLTRQFSGKGLVGDAVIADPAFLAAVAAGAAITVLAATRAALPISTTHALIGGLLGAGLAAGDVNLGALAAVFVAPLLLSPIVSAAFGFVAQWLAGERLRGRDCMCVTREAEFAPAATAAARSPSMQRASATFSSAEVCNRLLETQVRVAAGAVLDRVHIASAAIVCFARSTNDTPKLAALLLVAQGFGGAGPAVLTGVAMVAGGFLFSRRVAETMSLRLNRLDPAQGLTANLVTATLVLSASAFALPVSTTHVSVGAIAGVGAQARTVDWRAVRTVLASWVATLPFAAVCAWLIFHGIGG
ncbi:MAG: inorganic phosphate transporter [Caulobacteraceae bacterium]